MKRGFTLIELLIVVAIIAILAAIAVPNFLEAQVRSKVSRAKTDMRSIATAIESYAVDWNRAPLGVNEIQKNTCAGAYAYFQQDPPWSNEQLRRMVLSKTTTPVAYMTSVPQDPFKDKGAVNMKNAAANVLQRAYTYQSCSACFNAKNNVPNNAYFRGYKAGYSWVLRSCGPLRNESGGLVETVLGDALTFPEDTCSSYDPTNGTNSMGWIIRSNKGEFTVATN